MPIKINTATDTVNPKTGKVIKKDKKKEAALTEDKRFKADGFVIKSALDSRIRNRIIGNEERAKKEAKADANNKKASCDVYAIKRIGRYEASAGILEWIDE